jgi:hypothetical protein
MTRVRIAAALLALTGLTAFGAGCGASQSGRGETTSGTPEPTIAETWRAKCGNCHTRVEPGTRTRAQLDDALARHRTRARLSDEEWAQLEDFLASK